MNHENYSSIENVINPKSLERQIKLIEQRLMDLQQESTALEQRRAACHLLLGIPLAPIGANAEAAPQVAAKKTSRPKKKIVEELSADSDNAQSDDEDDEIEEEVSVIRASELHADPM